MSNAIELVDTRAVQSSLDALRRQVLSSPDAALLEGGKSLLLRLLEAPARPLDEPEPAELRGWIATRAAGPDGTRSITCWTEEDGDGATLLGEWKGPSLDWWSVTIGDRSYVSQLAAPDPTAPASPSLGDRARKQFQEWVSSHPRRRSYCAVCSFENEEKASVCVMCGGVIAVAPAAFIGKAPREAILKETQEIESVQPALPAQVVALPAPAPAPAERVPPIAAPRFEVVLRSFPRPQREALLVLLRDMLGDTAHPEELIASLPAVIETRISIVRARELSDKLRTVEASIEIRRTRS